MKYYPNMCLKLKYNKVYLDFYTGIIILKRE